ncbi:hypothetical protein [Dactylosporangium sp. NPDC049140]|uniref:hypothetical protein n=1 Tax=Dactylosporangium sp. NPDC049140 TaxID=3155647 RepID=UPI0033C1667B
MDPALNAMFQTATRCTPNPMQKLAQEDQLQLAAQRISLLKPGNAIPAIPAGAQPCPPGLRQHVEALIRPAAATAAQRER